MQKNTPFENQLPFLLTHSLTEHVFLNLHILNKQITFFFENFLTKIDEILKYQNCTKGRHNEKENLIKLEYVVNLAGKNKLHEHRPNAKNLL